MNKPDMDTVQSVDRALQVLETIARRGSISLNDLRQEIGLNKASLLRLAHTLVSNGYLNKDGQTGNYSLTLKTYEVGISVIQRGNQINLVNTVLGDLSKDSGLIAQFSVEDNNELLCLQSIGQTNPVFSAYTNAGKRSNLYSTSAGKAILSTCTNEEVIKKWETFDVRALTQNTHTDVQSLLRDLAEIRRSSYALDREENEYSLFCIGSVVMNHTQSVVGAISVSSGVPFGESEEQISKLVINASRRLSGLLGYAAASIQK